MICLRDLLKVPSLLDLKVIAGKSGLSGQISTVTLLDAPDGPQWLKGREFVLTSAYIFDNDYQLLEKYIVELIEIGAGGLGIKTGRFLDQIPERIIEIAKEKQFPIIQIPYHLVWTDIIAPFYKLKYGLEGHKNPVEIQPDMILPLFEASRWGGKRLLIQMAELFPHLPLAVYNQDGVLVINNGVYGVEQIAQALKQINVMAARGTPQSLVVSGFVCGLVALPVSYDGRIEYLAAASEQEQDVKEITKLVDLFGRLGSKDILALRKKTDAYQAFLHKVATASVTDQEAEDFERARAGDKRELIYSGILIFSSENYLQVFQIFKNALDLYQKGKKIKSETYLYDQQNQKQAVVLWEIYSSEKVNSNVLVKGLVQMIDSCFAKGEQGRIGISTISDSLKKAVCLYEQAQQALQLGSILWQGHHCYCYSDYEIYQILYEAGLERISFGDCTLLMNHKSTMSFLPLETAEAYIESGNYKRAAAKLFIHENTLRYRINKINELLNINLEDPVEAYRFLIKIKLWKLKCMKINKLEKSI